MIILGVDPGTIITGYGIIEKESKNTRLISSGVITLNSKITLALRLKKIYDELTRQIDEYLPDEFAIETAFYGKNIQSTLKLGHARGVSMLAAINHEIPVTEYSPREIKKAICGNGAASKQQVKYMVENVLGIKKNFLKFDETDAIAIAMCHLQKFNSPQTKPKNWKTFISENPDLIVG